MSIKRTRNSEGLDAAIRRAGIPEGQSNVAPRSDVRYYILCPLQEWFMRYVRESGKKLQDCKCVATEEACRGISFASPNVELILLDGWDRLESPQYGRDRLFLEEAYRLISRYCIDKRVHEVPTYVL